MCQKGQLPVHILTYHLVVRQGPLVLRCILQASLAVKEVRYGLQRFLGSATNKPKFEQECVLFRGLQEAFVVELRARMEVVNEL